MIGTRIVTSLVAMLMIAALFYVAGSVTAFDAEIDEAEIAESTIDEDGDGRINYLVISVPLDVVEVEGYERTYLYAELRNSLGPEIIESLNVSVSIGSSFAGTIWVDLEFNGRLINASLINGPYDVYMELVYSDSSSYPPSYYVAETYTYGTDAYAYDDFETPDPYLIEEISWMTVDDDDNALWDWLQINVTVNATDGDIVKVATNWSFECSDFIAKMESEQVLEVSEDQEVVVQMDGRILNAFDRQDTQYYVIVNISTSDGYAQVMSSTSPEFYDGSEFEPYVLAIVGDILWEPMDVNTDGLTDFLKISYNVTVTVTDKYRIQTDIEDVNVTHFGADNFEGYLIEGYEETIVTFIEADKLYGEGMPGPYNITITENPMAYDKWPGFESIADVQLGNCSVASFDIDQLNHPETLFVSGYILDEEGLELQNADVYFRSDDFTWLWSSNGHLTTGPDGMYNFTEAMPGVLNIGVNRSGYFDEYITIPDFASNTTMLNITLEERTPENSTVRGTVFDASDEPVPYAFIGLIRIGSGICNETDANHEGNFTVNVKEGDYLFVSFVEDPSETMINVTYAHVTVPANDTVWLNLTLNQTIAMPDEMSMSGSMLIDFPDWNSLDMSWNIDMSSFGAALFFELAFLADIQYGNADGYVDEDEAALFEDLFVAEFMGDGFGAQSGLYSLDLFCVDGIGYYVPPEAIDFAIPDITGPTWSVRDDVAIDVAFSGAEAYWDVADNDSHTLYFEIDYVTPESDFSSMVFEVIAPTGYLLTGTNEPANVTIEGFNHVIVTPGGPPDPEEDASSVLVSLTFAREVSEDTGSIHGIAALDGELDHSGIDVELLDSDLEDLDSVVTGSTGEFVFLDLEPGNYYVRASMTGYMDAYADVTVVAGETQEVEMTLISEGSALELGSITGAIVTQAGLPIDGASVDLYLPVGSSTALESVETESNGSFTFDELEAGEYRLEVSEDGFADRSVIVLLNVGEDKDLGDIELVSDTPVGYITGILQDIDGSPIGGVTVQVRAAESDTILETGLTDSTGTFMIVGFADGDYNLTFILDGKTIGHADVTVDDFIGDAGTIVIDLASIDFEDDELPWFLILLVLAVLAIAGGVAAAWKMRKPKEPPMKFEEPEAETGAVDDDLPPPPPDQ